MLVFDDNTDKSAKTQLNLPHVSSSEKAANLAFHTSCGHLLPHFGNEVRLYITVSIWHHESTHFIALLWNSYIAGNGNKVFP